MIGAYIFKNYPIRYEGLGTGPIVAKTTLDKMKSIIIASSKNWQIIEWARSIVSHCPWKSAECEISSLYDYVQKNMRYIFDPHGTELVQTPLVALEKIQAGQVFNADCDDATILILSLAKAIGYPVAMRVASYKPDRIFSHVYGLINMRGMWTPVDPIKIQGYIGWEAPNATNMADIMI